MDSEPCLCGDYQCPRCFPRASEVERTVYASEDGRTFSYVVRVDGRLSARGDFYPTIEEAQAAANRIPYSY